MFIQAEGGTMKGKRGVDVSKCNACGGEIMDEYYDAKTKRGPWGNLCPECFKDMGVGLGVGLGQHYVRVEG